MDSLARRAILVTVIVCALGAAAYLADPITRLWIRLTWIDLHSIGWKNGFWALVKAPATATPADLVTTYYASYKATGPVTILEAKKVRLDPSLEIYTVALVNGPHGRKLLVFSWDSKEWEAREYDP